MKIATVFLSLAAFCTRAPETPLILAAREGDALQIRALVAQGASPNQRGGVNGWTALEHAIHKNQIGSAAALLDAGADPNAASLGGMTPLIMAAGYGYTPIVELLLKRGANPRLADGDGHNALDAAMSGVGDIDRFTVFDCQISTVETIRRDVPDLTPRGHTQLAEWTKRCK